MRKDEIEKAIRDMDIERQVEKRVRYHCIAFWSGMIGAFGMLGSFITANSIAFKAAMRTFLDIWLSK